ncbi:hypothetical protein BJV78DRAFT_1221710 [Lactifluus subvellereus]|nr:hypothetical protein BJV78DRAFT_1221710 [Lactifluus subvellereus]
MRDIIDGSLSNRQVDQKMGSRTSRKIIIRLHPTLPCLCISSFAPLICKYFFRRHLHHQPLSLPPSWLYAQERIVIGRWMAHKSMSGLLVVLSIFHHMTHFLLSFSYLGETLAHLIVVMWVLRTHQAFPCYFKGWARYPHEWKR